MFTGLVEAIGNVLNLRTTQGGGLLTIRAPFLASELAMGQSVAVAGVCLTVCSPGEDVFSVDVMPETLKKTKLGSLRPGAPINLERALRVDGRLDGHIVTGHIDGVAAVREIARGREGFLVTFSLTEEMAALTVPLGSIAVDGVSLTVARTSGASCTVGLIPTTLESTTLGDLRAGDEVNIETDILGKYVKRLLRGGTPSNYTTESTSLSRETLREAGWL